MSRQTSFEPSYAVSERTTSTLLSKAFAPPREKPPPIPMPYAERTIYVHVKNEQEFQPEKTEAVNVFGRRVLISKGAKSEIQRVVSTEVEDSFTTPSVPTPLPAGNEIAAVWASNLAYPRGHAQRFKSQLAESYSKIPLEEYEKKHRRVSGDQILAVLDLPNLATSDLARSDHSQVNSK